MLKFVTGALLTGALLALPVQASAQRQKIDNDLSKCSAGSGPAILVTVDGIESSRGNMRVQYYRGTKSDWLEKGRWLKRIEAPAKAGSMQFCLPVDRPGTYGVAVRHDSNGNGKTDLSEDGGGMSRNPSINIFNLGKPSYKKTQFSVNKEVKSIRIQMRYM